MSAHSLCSPSGADRWSVCPASIKAELERRRLNISTDTDCSREGTEAHAYAASVLTGHKTIDDIPEGFRDGVKFYVDSILADVEFGGRILGVEKYLDYPTDSRIAGTPDCVHRIGDCIVVTDLKYGAGNYVHADALQLKIYGLLAIRKYRTSKDTHIELRVVQPRYIRDYSDPIRSVFFEIDLFQKSMIETLAKALKQIDDHPDLIVPGDHCKYCPIMMCTDLPPCPAHVEKYREILQAAPVDGLTLPNETQLTEVEKLKRILDSEEIILALIKRAKTDAYNRIYKGEKIDGYELSESLGNRKWKIPDSQIGSELRKLGLTYGQIWTEKLITPAQAEKSGLKGNIDNLVTRESKGLILSRETKIDKKIKHGAKKILAENPLPEKE